MESLDLKPFSQACQNNRAPILKHLRRLLDGAKTVLEVGSGTGQHAVHFAKSLPDVTWLASDLEEHHAGIRLWMAEYDLPNLRGPFVLDVNEPWPELPAIDAIYSANTAHIMAWPSVEQLFAKVGAQLSTGGLFVLYGPMNYGGSYTSESNERFDVWLKAQDPERGIRDFEKIQYLAQLAHLQALEDNEMPANNRLLVWRKA
ncbi:class I SAM-dependent methyltransferase [Simiduia litorea]|uniref:DUF938 domain-containing protein n=1 Tax=Simiduia litorea TaxID=1435348 RepID=UPI0036F1D8D4